MKPLLPEPWVEYSALTTASKSYLYSIAICKYYGSDSLDEVTEKSFYEDVR